MSKRSTYILSEKFFIRLFDGTTKMCFILRIGNLCTSTQPRWIVLKSTVVLHNIVRVNNSKYVYRVHDVCVCVSCKIICFVSKACHYWKMFWMIHIKSERFNGFMLSWKLCTLKYVDSILTTNIQAVYCQTRNACFKSRNYKFC